MTPLPTEQVADGILRVAVPSDTLPPATSTNAWVLGGERVIVVDPGGRADDVRAGLLDSLAAKQVQAVVLTHHHPDHTAGVRHLTEATGVGVWAHPDTGPMVPFPLERRLREGDRIETDCGTWTVLHTPGHAIGHICLLRDDGYAVVGDLLAGEGTILIAPPEGHLATYLHSLRRMVATGLHTALPAHGPALAAQALLASYIEHRGHRTEQVLAALAGGEATPLELAQGIYAELPPAVHPIAAIQLGSHLTWLSERNRVHAHPSGRFSLHAHVD